MGKNSQRTEEIELLCRLSESELEEEAKKLTELIVEKSRQEAERKSISAAYGEHIKKLEEKIEDQVPIVADRQKRKKMSCLMVSCLIEYNKPSLGKKTVTRLDLNTVVGVYDMNEDEKQDIFYNSETDDTIDVPAVKLLPAAEDTAEVQPKNLLPAAEDEQQIIHVEKPELGERCQVDLEVGKLYEIEGVVCRCDRETNGQCDGCMLHDKENLCYEYNFSCDGVILKAGVVRPDKEEQNNDPTTPEDKPAEEEETEQTEETEEPDADMTDLPDGDFDPANFCSICGKQYDLYHINQGKVMCVGCINNKNQKYLSKIEKAIREKKTILVRPSFGYGCISEHADTTCFRFLIGKKDNGKGSSWGTPIYIPGDYRQEGTEAADYYKQLIEDGVKEG